MDTFKYIAMKNKIAAVQKAMDDYRGDRRLKYYVALKKERLALEGEVEQLKKELDDAEMAAPQVFTWGQSLLHYVQNNNEHPLIYTNEVINIRCTAYFTKARHTAPDDIYIEFGRPIDQSSVQSFMLSARLDDLGKIQEDSIVQQLRELWAELIAKVSQSSLMGCVIYIVPEDGDEVRYVEDEFEEAKVYEPKVKIIPLKTKRVRNVRFDNDFVVYAEPQGIYNYEFLNVKNMQQAKGLCSKQFLERFNYKSLMLNGQIIDVNANFTANQIIDIIEQNQLLVHILYVTQMPFYASLYEYQIFMHSGHIYISKPPGADGRGKALMKTKLNAEIQKAWLDGGVNIVSYEELKRIAEDKISVRQIPYIVWQHLDVDPVSGAVNDRSDKYMQLVYSEQKLYITEEINKTMQLSYNNYGKVYTSFTIYPMFKDFLQSACQLVAYRFIPMQFVDASHATQGQKITQIDYNGMHRNALMNLQSIYRIVKVIPMYDNFDGNWTMYGGTDWYGIEFEYNRRIPGWVWSFMTAVNCYNTRYINYLVYFAREYNIKGVIKNRYIVEKITKKKVRLDDGTFVEKNVKFEKEKCCVEKSEGVWMPIGDYNKLNINIGIGMLNLRQVQQKSTICLDINGKQEIVYGNTYNNNFYKNAQFIHCQIMNQAHCDFIQHFAMKNYTIIEISTDHITLLGHIDYDTTKFKPEPKEVKKYGYISNFRYTESVKHFYIAYPGSGKSTYIVGSDPVCEKCGRFWFETASRDVCSCGGVMRQAIQGHADKTKDCIITVNNQEKMKAIAKGYINVFNYQYLNFSGNYSWFQQFQNIWIDEFMLISAECLNHMFNLPYVKGQVINFVGDPNQMHNRNETVQQYRFCERYIERFPQRKTVLDKNNRNEFNYEEVLTAQNPTQEIIRIMTELDMVRRIDVKSGKVYRGDVEVEVRDDEMYVVKTNEKAYFINQIAQNKGFNRIIRTDALSKKEPEIFVNHSDHMYLNERGTRVKSYWGIAQTVYSYQGQQAPNVKVDIENMNFNELFTAFSRLQTKGKMPVYGARLDERIVQYDNKAGVKYIEHGEFVQCDWCNDDQVIQSVKTKCGCVVCVECFAGEKKCKCGKKML